MSLDNFPFVSQYRDTTDDFWKSRACALACVLMVMKFQKKEGTLDDLIQEGVMINAYGGAIGWTHDGLVRLLRNHGVSAYPQEFKAVRVNPKEKIFEESPFLSSHYEHGISKIKKSLEEENPVIVSVSHSDGRPNSHMIVLFGVQEQGFIGKDPEIKEGTGDILISFEAFQKRWRKLAIFIDPAYSK